MDKRAAGDLLVRLIGTALAASGAYGLLDPLEMTRLFGVPLANTETARMYPGIGGRNLAAGITVWALSLGGERKALGVLLAIWGLVVGSSDTSICLKTKNRRADHMINTVVVCTTGLLATQNFEGTGSDFIWISGAMILGSLAKTIFGS